MYRGQANQDRFVLYVLKEKQNGYFLEIGSNHPIEINNTYLMENKYNWKGIMVEYDSKYLPLYKKYRPNSIHLINDARNIDYKKVFESNNVPSSIDYLQIDLDENDGSTINALIKLDAEILDTYKFATVTFEHDTFRGNICNTREISRQIFKKRGYVCIFEDVNNADCPYEDWYVHPDLVDMDYVIQLRANNDKNYVNHPLTGKTIKWQDINYSSV